MSNFKEEYNKVLEEINEKLKGKEELSFVNEKIVEISDLYTNLIVNLTSTFAEQIDMLETKTFSNEKRLEKIEDLIYEDDNTVEMLCPDCGNEFVVDLDELNEDDEIICPECNKTIDLVYNMDDDCSCDCESCNHDCGCE